jgi:hypothetical protein
MKHVFATYLTAIESTDVEGVGRVREDDLGNIYKWVQNVETVTSTNATQYGAACYEDTTLQSAGVPATANLGNLAGFWQAAVPGQSYGWIQCQGRGLVAIPAVTVTSAAFATALKPADGVETLATSTAQVALQNLILNEEALAVNTDATTVRAIIDCKL